MLLFIKPVPILLTFATMFGVLVHDMNIDKAAKVAVAPLTVYAASTSTLALDQFFNKSDHTHVERASGDAHYRSSMPKMQPPRNDDRKYTQNRKEDGLGGDDHTYLWPSV